MSIYGEGAYRCSEHGLVAPRLRTEAQLKARLWDPQCPACGVPLQPSPDMQRTRRYCRRRFMPSPRWNRSCYACPSELHTASALSPCATSTRTGPVKRYPTHTPAWPPYSAEGSLTADRRWCSRMVKQLRDLVHVRDVARATVLALHSEEATGQAINVGVGSPMTIVQFAQLLAKQMGADIRPEVTGKFRVGDIRHCWADPARAEKLLGFTAEIPLEAGVAELVDWVSTQEANDRVDKAYAELGRRGLAILWLGSPCIGDARIVLVWVFAVTQILYLAAMLVVAFFYTRPVDIVKTRTSFAGSVDVPASALAVPGSSGARRDHAHDVLRDRQN